MELSIAIVDPQHPDAALLVEQLTAELAAAYAHVGLDGSGGFSPADAAVPRAAFLVARHGGQPVGCGALRPTEDAEIGEIKRMYVAPAARRRGVALAILRRLEELAREYGYRRIVLETGDRQLEAIRLYERAGYRRIPCYGVYAGRPWSVCFGRDLAPAE